MSKGPSGVMLTLAIGGAALAWIVADHLSTPYDAAFDAEEKATGVPGNLLRAIARVESNMNPNAVNATTADYGLMQINAKTAARFGVAIPRLTDPRTSIHLAALVLAENRRSLGDRFSPYTWAASYNVGPDLKPATVGQAYAAKVVSHWQLYDFGRVLA